MRRTLSESLETRKEMMIAALWANSGFEGKDGANARRDAIESLELHYDDAIKRILTGNLHGEEEEIDKNNPFFQAAERGMKKIRTPRNDEGSVKEVVESEIHEHLDIDQ